MTAWRGSQNEEPGGPSVLWNRDGNPAPDLFLPSPHTLSHSSHTPSPLPPENRFQSLPVGVKGGSCDRDPEMAPSKYQTSPHTQDLNCTELSAEPLSTPDEPYGVRFPQPSCLQLKTKSPSFSTSWLSGEALLSHHVTPCPAPSQAGSDPSSHSEATEQGPGSGSHHSYLRVDISPQLPVRAGSRWHTRDHLQHGRATSL